MSIERHSSASRYAGVIGFSSAVRAGRTVYVSGVSAVAADGRIVGGADAYAQAAECVSKIIAALAEFGARADQVVRTTVYLVDAAHWSHVARAHAEVFGAAPPAATMVVVDRLLDEGMLVEIEAIAYLDE